jgi:hypothetical protein
MSVSYRLDRKGLMYISDENIFMNNKISVHFWKGNKTIILNSLHEYPNKKTE